MTEPGRARGLVPPTGWLRPAPAEPDGRRDALFVALITLLALLVRLYQLGHQSLWTDEILTWKMCEPGVGLRFWQQVRDSIQGPLYVAAVWPLARWCAAETALRLPAALAGAATVPLFFALARRLWDGPTARLAALLLALSPFHVWYSQEGRGYTFLILFAVASSLVFLELLRRGPGGREVLLYVLLMAGAVWSNLSALFLWAAHTATLVLVARPRERRAALWWALALGGSLVAAVPWLLQASGILAVDRLVPGAEMGPALRGETTFTPLAYGFTAFAFFFGYSLGPSLRELHQPDRLAVLRGSLPVVLPAVAVATAALGAGLIRLRRRQGLLLVWILVPLALLTVLALRNVKPFNPRYLAVIFPWLLLLAAAGPLGLPRRWGMGLAAALLALFLTAVAGHHLAPRYAKADLRGAAVLVNVGAADGEPVLVPVAARVFAHYHTGRGIVVPNWDFRPWPDAAAARAFLGDMLGGAPTAWLVLARQWRVDPDGHLPGVLAADGELLADHELTGVRVIHWRRTVREDERAE